MFAYPLPSILTHFQPILIENLSNPIRIKSKSIYFPCLGSLAGVISVIVQAASDLAGEGRYRLLQRRLVPSMACENIGNGK